MIRQPTVLERLTRQPLPGLDHPTRIRFSRDGRWIAYLQPGSGSGVRSLWRHDLATGQRQVLVPGSVEPPGGRAALRREEELLRQRRHESGSGVARYRSAADADCFTVVVQGRCLVSRDGRPAVAAGPWNDVQDALPSPDGSRIALVRSGDVWVTSPHGNPVQLTDSAAPGRSSGLAEYVAAEELDRFDGCWWSADGGALAWASVDEDHVPETDIAHAGPGGATTSDRHRYPFAGGPNASVTLVVRALGGSAPARPVELDIDDGYLARVVPHSTDGWLVAVLPRDQRTLRWWRVAATGSAVEAWEERADPWINLDDTTHVLSDGRILRTTEAAGFRHLELRAPSGAMERRLTAGTWIVTEVVHCDEQRGEALFVATADGPTQRHLYAVPLDAATPVRRPERLTAEAGWHAVVVAPDGGRWADTWSTRERAPGVTVRSRDGRREAVIHRASTSARRRRLVVPDLRTVTAGDGRTVLHAAVFDPPVPAGSRPPAVVWVYGGPHVQHARDAWELTVHPLRQALAAAGFVVIVVDGRGSANRGLAFEAGLAGALGTTEVDDQAAAVRALSAEGRIDGSRVGITGGSYGGYMTIRCLLRRSDTFRAGVAVAPVVDWMLYDTGYTERYLGNPRDTADAYARGSLIAEASRLAGDLLVIHGTLDENVHPRHTERLLEALSTAGRTIPVLWLAGERHRSQSRRQMLRRDRRTVAFLRRALGVSPAGDGQAATS